MTTPSWLVNYGGPAMDNDGPAVDNDGSAVSNDALVRAY